MRTSISIEQDESSDIAEITPSIDKRGKNPFLSNKGYLGKMNHKSHPCLNPKKTNENSIKCIVNKSMGDPWSLFCKQKTIPSLFHNNSEEVILKQKEQERTMILKTSQEALTINAEDEEEKIVQLKVSFSEIKAKTTPINYAKEMFSKKMDAETPNKHSIQAYLYKIENLSTPQILQKFEKNLKKYSGKKTLCLGLQYILMKVSSFASEDGGDIIPLSESKENPDGELTVYYRPFLKEFLESMAEKYELIIYSSFSEKYVNAILSRLEKEKKYFSYCFHDDYCLFANISFSVKCLDFLKGNRSFADIILIGNEAKELSLSTDNFVPIKAYHMANSQDTELAKLASFLDYLSEEEDVRICIKSMKLKYPS